MLPSPFPFNRNLPQNQSVSRLLAAQPSPPLPAAPPLRPADHLELRPPSALLSSLSATPPLNLSSPVQQLQTLARKYGIASTGLRPEQLQKTVIRTLISVKARALGIPEQIALAVASHESGLKMWSNLESGQLVAGQNIRNGTLKSTDWGVMQLNDKAHAGTDVFPRAKYDLEYNIDCGLRVLAHQRQRIHGDLGLGLGDWDRTVASYNLGHDPKTPRSLKIAQNYVSHVSAKLSR